MVGFEDIYDIDTKECVASCSGNLVFDKVMLCCSENSDLSVCTNFIGAASNRLVPSSLSNGITEQQDC